MKRTIEINLNDYGKVIAGRSTGKKIVQDIREAAAELSEPGLVLINLNNIDVIDYPAAHEIITLLHEMKLSGRFKSRQRVAIMGGRANVVESMEAALKLNNRVALYFSNRAGMKSLKWSVLGSMPLHLVETLRELHKCGETDALSFSRKLKIKVTACNNRLTELIARGLVYRKSGNNGERKVYLYGLSHNRNQN